MNKKVNTGGSRKRQKLPPPPPNQTMITYYFVLANPNSLLNVGHIPEFEANDEDDIVTHRKNKRVIVEDEEDVPNEVKLLEENVDTVTK